MIELKCARCGYNEFPCSVHTHHIDKDRHNNKSENLIYLCANCHGGLHHGFWLLEELNGNFEHPEGRPKRQKKPDWSNENIIRICDLYQCTAAEAMGLIEEGL